MGYALVRDRSTEFAKWMDERTMQQKNEVISESEREVTRQLIEEALYEVYDPELGIDIVDLGLVYGIEVSEQGFVRLTMTLTTPGCPMHESLVEGVNAALSDIPAITGGEISLVWDPPWEPARMSQSARQLLGLE